MKLTEQEFRELKEYILYFFKGFRGGLILGGIWFLIEILFL